MASAEYLLHSNANQYQEVDIEYLKLLLSQAERMEQLLRVQEDSMVANKMQGIASNWYSHIEESSPRKQVGIKHNSYHSLPSGNQNLESFTTKTNISDDYLLQKEDKTRRDSMFSDITDIETCDAICQEAITALEQNEREKQQLLLEIQEERKKYVSERSQLQIEIEKLKHERENAEKLQDKWKTEAESLKEKLVVVSQQLEERQLPSYEQLNKELQKMTTLYKNQNEALQQLREEKLKLLQELEEKEASKIDLRMKLSSVESDLQLLERNKARVDKEYERLQKQLVGLEEEKMKVLKEKETSSNQEIDSLRKKLTKQANEKMELVQQLESIREEYKELKTCIVEEYEQMKSQYDQLSLQQSETLKQLDKLKNEYNNLLQANENLHKKNEELEGKCKALEEQLLQLNESQDRSRSMLDEESYLKNIRDTKKKILEKDSEAMERERQLFIKDLLAMKRKVVELQQLSSLDSAKRNIQSHDKSDVSAFQIARYCMEDILPRPNLFKKVPEPSKVWLQKVQQISQNMKGHGIKTNLQKAFVNTFRQDKRNKNDDENAETNAQV